MTDSIKDKADADARDWISRFEHENGGITESDGLHGGRVLGFLKYGSDASARIVYELEFNTVVGTYMAQRDGVGQVYENPYDER
jgi:hypothetical protein